MKNFIYSSILGVALCAACAHKSNNQSTSENATNGTPSHQATEPSAEVQGPLSAQAVMKPAKQQKAKGVIHFTQSRDKVKVEAMMEGLKPGPHGFHIHEKGDCSAPDFMSAGGHFNPHAKPHGEHTSTERHVGDMGNLIADSKGKATLTLELSHASIGGANGVLGKGVIVHENADDLKTQPTGNAGGRVSCGVIEALK